MPVALGAFFTTDAASGPRSRTPSSKLMHTHDESIADWTRDGSDTRAAGRSKFRTEPPRKYLWQYKNAAACGWGLDGGTGLP